MRVGVIGAGYVGLITAVGFALKGNQVRCFDIDAAKVDKINNKVPPIFEVGLKEALSKVVPSNLTADLNFEKLVTDSEVIFICVGTPSLPNGSQDLTFVKNAAEEVGKQLAKTRGFKTIVMKSTVLPTTNRRLVKEIIEKSSRKKHGIDFVIASNPEFLREGRALNDFLYPDRVVIGVEHDRAEKVLYSLYSDFSAPILVTSLEAAEMIKYASNAFLAAKISFINEIGALCKSMGIDAYEVAKGIGMDKRIGPSFLQAGLGWGGSCFPKDTLALIALANEKKVQPDVLSAIFKVNARQPAIVAEVVEQLKGVKKVGVLGLSFKPDTDDVRDSQAIPLIELLLKKGYSVNVFDPKAMENFKRVFSRSSKLAYAENSQDLINKSECVIIATEWPQFEQLNYADKFVIDTRNCISKERRSTNYYGLYW